MAERSDGGPRDLYVRMALVEQALVHAESTQTLLHESMIVRARAAEDQIGRVAARVDATEGRIHSHEWWGQQTSQWLSQHAEMVAGISKRQIESDKLAARLRYGLAAALLLLVAADQVGPESKAIIKGVALKAFVLP